MYGIDSVAALATEEAEQTANGSIASNSSLETATTNPWMIFLYALKAPATKEKYIQRLTKFLDSLGYQGTREEKARAFAAQARADHIYAFNSILKFFQSKREQIGRKEMAIGTVRNYVKSIDLFCDMANCGYLWAKSQWHYQEQRGLQMTLLLSCRKFERLSNTETEG